MRPRVLLQVAEGGEMFIAELTVECLAVVESPVGQQSVSRIERHLARLAHERLLFGVDANMDLEAVGGEEGLSAPLFRANESEVAWNEWRGTD